jgi:hypothetical protein
MMKIWLNAIIGLTLCSFALAQESAPAQPNNAQPAGAPRIAPGSVIPVRLAKTVDAKKAKTGDEVDALVTQDLKSVNGQVIVTKDTKVVGHVTEAQARTKEQKESQLGITFDHAVLQGGNLASLPMSIQAVIAAPNQNSGNDSQAAGGTAPPTSASAPAGNAGGRSGTAGMPQSAPQQNTVPSAGGETTSAAPQITANTQGVVGISNYTLSKAGEAEQGSLVRSEKENVKLESGTFLLLRVNQ